MLAKFGDRNNFLIRFNPNMQRDICVDAKQCFFGDYPTLRELKAYGERFASAWLVPQLYNLSEFCGCKDKLTGTSLEECAFTIATEFSYLKVTELMLFFHKFKSGSYGKFYGSVDPLVITTALRTFLQERNYAYIRHDSGQKVQEAEEYMMKDPRYRDFKERRINGTYTKTYAEFLKEYDTICK